MKSTATMNTHDSMKNTTFLPAMFAVIGLSLSGATGVKAALVWTGAADGASLFNEGNWDLDGGGAPAANTINPNSAITATPADSQVTISSGTGEPANYGGTFNLNGNALTVGGGKTLGSASGQINGNYTAHPSAGTFDTHLFVTGAGSTVDVANIFNFDSVTVTAGGLIDVTTSFAGVAGGGVLTVSGGGTFRISSTAGFAEDSLVFVNGSGSLLDAQYMGASSGDIAVDGGRVNMRGAGALNGNFTLDLATVGSQLSLANVLTGSIDDTVLANNNITVGGQPAEIGVNATLESFNGGSGSLLTVVPEPSGFALAALGLLGVFGRRRRS